MMKKRESKEEREMRKAHEVREDRQESRARELRDIAIENGFYYKKSANLPITEDTEEGKEYSKRLMTATQVVQDFIAQGNPGSEEFPRTVAVGDLDETALLLITEAAIIGWYSTQFNTLLTPAEAEELLPKLGKLPIDWGTPLAHWPRQRVIEFIKGISWLLAERGTLDSHFWDPRPLSFPWPNSALNALKSTPGGAAPNGPRGPHGRGDPF
jgi:hypothetical protein